MELPACTAHRAGVPGGGAEKAVSENDSGVLSGAIRIQRHDCRFCHAEFSALQSSSAELRTQLETLQPDISALKNIRKYIDMVLNKQQLSAPGGKTSEKESVLKKLHEAKATAAPKKSEQQKNTPEL